METRNDQAAKDKVFDLIKDIQVAQLVTVDPSGKLRSRPMIAQRARSDGELWFFASAASHKLDEIASHRQVLLNYSDPRAQNYVSVLGRASVVREKAKIEELWSEPARVWFPQGVDDPDIALICVVVEEADYWDSPSSTLVHAYGYVKAVATGERPNPGENKHVAFSEGADKRP